MEGRITIVMNIYKDICLIHKPGGAPLDPLILEQSNLTYYFINL